MLSESASSAWRPTISPNWLFELTVTSKTPQLHTFAAGIRLDLAAVTVGLSLPYNSGASEGNVNGLKALKRQMCGRASLDLLRKRVIHRPGRQRPKFLVAGDTLAPKRFALRGPLPVSAPGASGSGRRVATILIPEYVCG